MNMITAAPREAEQPPVMVRRETELAVALNSLSLGGAERIVLDWAERIYPRWRTHVIVLRDVEKEWPVPDSVKITRLHGKRLEEQLRGAGKLIASGGNPVCICHLLRKNERDALKKGGAEVVTVLHNARDGWLEGASSLSGSARVIAVSEACAQDARASGYSGPLSVIRHIPPPVKTDADIRTLLRRKWRIPERAAVVGMVGAVKSQKNYQFALRVLKSLLEKEDAYLVIVGGPVRTKAGRDEWMAIIDGINRLGLRQRVAMPGFIPNAASCLSAFDVMLNTSHYEGLSIATLEALSCGLPVVAGKVGGQGEIGCPGLALLPKDAPAEVWASSLEKALHLKFAPPAWSRLPSYRLWTLFGLARPFKPTSKTLFIAANLNAGGAQRSLVNLAQAIRSRLRFEVVVAGNSTASYFYRQLKKAGIRVTRAGERWDAFAHAENLVEKICRERFGTVIFWNVDARIKLLLAKALDFTGVRFIDVSPGDYYFDEMRKTEEFQRLIAFTEENYRQRLDKYVVKYDGSPLPGHEKKTVVIPNGILRPQKIKTDYTIRGSPRVAVSGRIAPSKFILEIISAMKIVRNDLPQAELHIFGAAEHYYRDYARAVQGAARTEAGKRVFFHGQDFEAISRLPEYDAYVVLGRNQGCPNALMEAMAVGMPAIANDDGGTSEQLRDGKTGLLVKSYSPEELARSLALILTDRDLAARLGRAARDHIRENFSLERMADGYLDLIRNSRRRKRRLGERLLSLLRPWRTGIKITRGGEAVNSGV